VKNIHTDKRYVHRRKRRGEREERETITNSVLEEREFAIDRQTRWERESR
jgi:hypothetical protein